MLAGPLATPTARRLAAILTLASALLGACTAPDGTAVAERRTQRGDTLVIVSGGAGRWGAAELRAVASVGDASGSDTVILGQLRALDVGDDGRVYAVDGQLLAVRVFDAQLRPLALWGRDGSGPAELRNPDGGLAALSDGRVVVRDPGNARFQVFSATGASAGEWRVADAGLRTRDPFGRQGDTLLSRVVVEATGPIETWRYGYARITPDGRVLDTLAFPAPTLPRRSLVARRGGNTAELPLPFAPLSLFAWHPRGGFVLANGDRYAVTWPGPQGLVRVEREVAAVAVSAAEAAQERSYVTKGLQWLDPAWQWTGPDVPSTKPFISALYAGRDGSVWLLREGDAVDGDDPEYRPGDASSVERRLRSALQFDAFTADGEFLGTLPVPNGLQLRPQPVFRADGVVALTLDTLGVPRLVRYEIATPARR